MAWPFEPLKKLFSLLRSEGCRCHVEQSLRQMEARIMAAIDELKAAITDLAAEVTDAAGEIDMLLTKILASKPRLTVPRRRLKGSWHRGSGR